MTSKKGNRLLDSSETFPKIYSSKSACSNEKGTSITKNSKNNNNNNNNNNNKQFADSSDIVAIEISPGVERNIVGKRSGKNIPSHATAQHVPDGGWGWMVAVGSFIVMMLVPMLFPCFGILFSGYLLARGTSSITTAWIFNIQGFLWNIMGLFVRPLVDQFGWRCIGFVGISLVSISLLVSAFAPSPLFLFFSLSLLSGVGGGTVTSICFLIVPIYFEKRRGMANAIMMMGICIGEILGPLLVRLLLDEYGFLGANLLIGAIILNGYIGILFFHPVQWHTRKTAIDIHNPLLSGVNHVALQASDDCEGNAFVGLPCDEFKDNELGTVIKDHTIYLEKKLGSSLESLPLNCDIQDSSWTVMSANLIKEYSKSGSENFEEFAESNCKFTLPKEKHSKSFLYAVYCLVSRAIRDLVILKSPRAAIIATGNMLCMNSVLNFVMMVPFAMQALGFTLQDSAWCISVSAVCNLLTRMVVSPLSDWARFSMKICYMGGYAILAIVMLIFPMLSDLKWMEGAMGLLGCAWGANMAFYNLVMIEYMGLDNLAPVFGASGLMVGTGFLLFGTVSGLVRDMSGSYKASMWMLSAMSATSFFLWVFMPSAVSYDRRAQGKLKDLVPETDAAAEKNQTS